MKKTIAALLAADALTTAAHAQDPTTTANDLAKQWVTAYDSGNAASVAALFTKDAVFSPATAALIKGRAAIEEAVVGRMKAGFTKETVELTEAHQSGDVIWASGRYTVVASGASAGKQVAGRFGEVLIRDGNDWLLAMLTGNGGLN